MNPSHANEMMRNRREYPSRSVNHAAMYGQNIRHTMNKMWATASPHRSLLREAARFEPHP